MCILASMTARLFMDLRFLLVVGIAFTCMPFALHAEDKPTAKPESVKPGINQNFLDPGLDVTNWITRFEGESREVYTNREKIVSALELKAGMAVADVGAGTGIYMGPFSKAVGPSGKVIAVDISEAFIKHLKQLAQEHQLANVEVLQCAEDSTKLPEGSVDLVFVCDTYHHFEYPASTVTSIFKALKPGGRFAVIDFERIEGVSREWTMDHVRAGKEVFAKEITDVGFEKVKEIKIADFKENYFLLFRKP